MTKPKMSTEQFVKRSRDAHGEKYDYSESVFSGVENKVAIRCGSHGVFLQSAALHLRGHGCKQCHIDHQVQVKRDQFLQRARAMHGDRYLYHKTFYSRSALPVVITCRAHGDFEQRATCHLRGQGCQKCQVDGLRKSTEDFVSRARLVHGDKYSYEHAEYTAAIDLIAIRCPVHGIFHQAAIGHLSGKGCRKCGRASVRHTTESFIEYARRVHGDTYLYEKVDYRGAASRVVITCRRHGDYSQRACSHLHGRGCADCNESSGERRARLLLERYGIDYESQWRHPGCKRKKELPFDFYVPSKNVLIEIDGIQHAMPVSFFGGLKKFAQLQINDAHKTKWAIESGYDLLRIPHTEWDRIEEIMRNKLLITEDCFIDRTYQT